MEELHCSDQFETLFFGEFVKFSFYTQKSFFLRQDLLHKVHLSFIFRPICYDIKGFLMEVGQTDFFRERSVNIVPGRSDIVYSR